MRPGLIVIGALAAVLSAKSATADGCRARLHLKVTPDVPDPTAQSFLSALTSSPLYEIIWIKGHDTSATVELRGPATDFHCKAEIERMRRDSQIEELKVLQAD
jgi:hypothetical protein